MYLDQGSTRTPVLQGTSDIEVDSRVRKEKRAKGRKGRGLTKCSCLDLDWNPQPLLP